MIQNGMYYMTDSYKELMHSLGGEWNDRKKRPIVCLLQSTENPDLYWAIPVGKVNHRDENVLNKINIYMNYSDIRSCYSIPAQTSRPRSKLGRKGLIQLTLPHCCSSPKEVRKGPQTGKEPGGRS